MPNLTYRTAVTADISEIQRVRHLVKENTLSDPSLVPDEDVETYLIKRGKGWVCEADGKIVGFSIADLEDNNVWALFIDPVYEGIGIGKTLHKLMLDWYFTQTSATIWLGTDQNTRAEQFYRLQGWKQAGKHTGNELKFEMTAAEWEAKSKPGH